MSITQDSIKKIARNPRSERVKLLFDFEPTDYQARLLDYHEKQAQTQAAVKPGRQVGKTLTGGAIAADYILFTGDAMILAPFQDTAEEMMDAATNNLETAKQRVQQAGFDLSYPTDNKTEYETSVGHKLRMRTVGREGTQIRGKNPSCVLVDEAAYIKDSIYQNVIEEFFITHPEYEYYLFSTPAGKNGYFYHAVEGNNSDQWFSPHWPTEISPFAQQDFIDRKREELDSTTFAQEYLGEFVDEADSWIPHDLVMPCIKDHVTREPRAERYLGVDIARKGKDRTVYVDLDSTGLIRNIWSEETSTIPGIANRIKNLHETNGYESVFVDENAVGGGVVDAENLSGIVTGIPFTTKSKHEMYTRLKRDFEQKEITIPADIDHRRRLVNELTSLRFGFTANGYVKVSHPENGHDDYPDALALANYGRKSTMTVTRKRGGGVAKGSMT